MPYSINAFEVNVNSNLQSTDLSCFVTLQNKIKIRRMSFSKGIELIFIPEIDHSFYPAGNILQSTISLI